MLVELTGCSSAGKSTLLKRMDTRGGGCSTREDEMNRYLRIERLPRFLRTVVEDLAAAQALVANRKALAETTSATRRAARAMPAEIGRRERANRIRNAYRHIGIFLFLNARVPKDRVVFLDTGPVHTAHNMFIHMNRAPVSDEIDDYLLAIPLPDWVLILEEEEDELVSRTLDRGHRRVAAGSEDEARRFNRHAIATFSHIARNERLRPIVATLNTRTSVGSLAALPDAARVVVENALAGQHGEKG